MTRVRFKAIGLFVFEPFVDGSFSWRPRKLAASLRLLLRLLLYTFPSRLPTLIHAKLEVSNISPKQPQSTQPITISKYVAGLATVKAGVYKLQQMRVCLLVSLSKSILSKGVHIETHPHSPSHDCHETRK